MNNKTSTELMTINQKTLQQLPFLKKKKQSVANISAFDVKSLSVQNAPKVIFIHDVIIFHLTVICLTIVHILVFFIFITQIYIKVHKINKFNFFDLTKIYENQKP